MEGSKEGLAFPAGSGGPDEGLRARLASLERYFSVPPAEAQELQASSQQPHPSLQACSLISKHGPLHRLRGSLPATNLSALSGGGRLAACVPSFSRGSSLGPKAIQCLGAPEPVWPHLDPGGRAPAAVLPTQLEPHSEASPKLPWPYVPPLFLDHWAESKHGRKVPQSFRSLGSLRHSVGSGSSSCESTSLGSLRSPPLPIALVPAPTKTC